ncbi:phosphotransferase [Cellulomonas sp. ATA003]|uniref:phosphotransferase n=1 Tax=Cellulomonas sp. ATA003 TaxID=3073064 RepID=UPI0028734087|nr:phosphotransferase [Cellulomonas sp. ATA003]WNB85802.1 phosphotransferase [Cellulomonas sp. ATA003]
MTSPEAAETDTGPGPVLTVGTTAVIYLLDDDRVLRRYREQHDLSREVAIMQHLRAHDFPVPQAYSGEGLDLEMERLHGPTLLQSLAAGETGIPEAGQLLADLHQRLHAVPPPEGAGDDVVVHLALHPANVILSERHGGPVLIDWATARTGPAALDVAVTAVIIAEVAVDEDDVEYSKAARALLAAFLAAADGDPVPHLEAAARIRFDDPSIVPGETALVAPAAELVRHFCSI